MNADKELSYPRLSAFIRGQLGFYWVGAFGVQP